MYLWRKIQALLQKKDIEYIKKGGNGRGTTEETEFKPLMLIQ